MKSFVCLIFVVTCYMGVKAQNGYGYETNPEGFFEEDHQLPPLFRVRRQLFGGRTGSRMTGFNHNVGYQHGRTWGSLSQDISRSGKTSPITYSGGSGFGLPGGHSISGTIDHQPKFGSHVAVRGDANLFSNKNHQVSAWAQHDRDLARNFRPVGRETNSGGLNYAHTNGATAFVSGSKTPGFPSTGSVGGTVPIATFGNGKIEAYGKTNFGHGMKPIHEGGIQGSISL